MLRSQRESSLLMFINNQISYMEKNQTQGLSESAIETMLKEQVTRIFERQKEKGVSPKWGTAEHCALIKNALCEIGILDGDNKDDIASLFRALQFKGLGGNSAQFRQWDFVKAKLPASAKEIVNALDY